MQDQAIDDDYDYDAAKAATNPHTRPSGYKDSAFLYSVPSKSSNNNNLSAESIASQDPNSKFPPDDDFFLDEEEPLNTEEALMDLVQLEELHTEAERKKAVGNKHMASQEYTQAYHAYSAALQLSPVGPSSHVFLSNRAAALLSLKKYPAAVTDARRAIALAPTFGKAHARLGQALYFLKDYESAVKAYEDAIQFEPDNEVTMTYLEKAKSKLEKQQQKKTKQQKDKASGQYEEASSHSVAESTQFTVQNSIATDPQARHAIIQKDQYRGITNSSTVMKNAAAGSMNSLAKVKEQVPQRPLHPHIGVPSSAASVAASAITMESEENRNHANNNSTSQNDQSAAIEDDPEFEEALRIQQRANKFLVQKQYRAAIEEYTAALFLVPNDPNLSPDLHLGRAHALNGSRRHESARNDAILAVKLNPTPAAYSTLAKSLFYMKEYAASIDAFNQCTDLLPPGETLGLFDRAYLEKCEKALLEEDSMPSEYQNRQQLVPKLPPPRFVPREEALQSQPPSLRPMPKEWPQQPVMQASHLKCGVEREILFLSESLGIKLNRGSDGIVRVLSVTPLTPRSVVMRQGDIQPGDVVREAAGVDIRRPITNIMWGDTVALIKMAPRPISFLVAKELSPVPHSVVEEQERREEEQTFLPRHAARSSNASGEESVAALMAKRKEWELQYASVTSDEVTQVLAISAILDNDNDSENDIMEVKDIITHDIVEIECDEQIEKIFDDNSFDPTKNEIFEPTSDLDVATNNYDTLTSIPEQVETTNEHFVQTISSATDHMSIAPSSADMEGDSIVKQTNNTTSHDLDRRNIVSKSELDDDDIVEVEDTKSRRRLPTLSETPEINVEIEKHVEIFYTHEEEEKIVGGEILFLRSDPLLASYCDWDTLRWMSYSGTRKVSFFQHVFRQFDGEKKRNLLPSFWRTGGKRYEQRALVVYEVPSLILILRRPASLEEIYEILGLPDIAQVEDRDKALEKYWVLESVADPGLSKLRLSPLTTITSLPPDDKADDRDRSCFQILTPIEAIVLSAVHVRTNIQNFQEQSFTDSCAYLEALSAETSIAKTLCAAHTPSIELSVGISWMHQIVIGSLHSIVLSGNIKCLKDSLEHAKSVSASGVSGDSRHLSSLVIDAKDEIGVTALYYACKSKMPSAIQHLVNAGADVTLRVEQNNTTLCHIVARNLDDSSIMSLFSTTLRSRPDANSLDNESRTPMYVAATEGCTLDNDMRPEALGRCLAALKAWGGQMMPSFNSKINRHPVSVLASKWLPEYLAIVLGHITANIPQGTPGQAGMSMSALCHYPIHFTVIALRNELPVANRNETLLNENRVISCLRLLFDHGFEPNERLERTQKSFLGSNDLENFVGFAPIQILGLIALELDSLKGKLDLSIYRMKMSLIADVTDFLIRNGARMSLEPPQLKRQRKKAINTKHEIPRRVDVLTARMDTDKQIVALLGGEKRIDFARKKWMDSKTFQVGEDVKLIDTSVILEDSDVPGGNDSSSCAICWVVFGTIMNRKHRCRVSGLFVCDDCSTKRLIHCGTEHRVSDGQFLHSCAGTTKRRGNASSATRDIVATKLDRLESEDQSNRDSLFGGFLEKATNFMIGEEEENVSSKVNGLSASLEKTRDALNERGEKLNSLNEKSAQLVDASADFAKMAKELRKQSEGGFFW